MKNGSDKTPLYHTIFFIVRQIQTADDLAEPFCCTCEKRKRTKETKRKGHRKDNFKLS